ncbi:MAG: SDR family oxidoreductase [Bacteroidota bacterium]
MKNVIITGSSSGFGLLAAKTIAQNGHKVWASMRNTNGKNAERKAELEKLATAENLPLKVLELDVTSDASVQEAINTVVQEDGKIDVLINNAGVMFVGITEAYGMEQIKTQMDVNFYGAVRTIKAALPHMRSAGDGLIINTSSLAGRLSFPYFGVYNASKFALEGYSHALRFELAPFGVEVSIVEPGPFGTNLLYSGPKETDSSVLDSYQDFKEVPAAMLKNFEGFFSTEDAPNPQIVADDYLRLINNPKGQRPARVVSGIDYGVIQYNNAVQPIEESLIKDVLQMPHLLGANG